MTPAPQATSNNRVLTYHCVGFWCERDLPTAPLAVGKDAHFWLHVESTNAQVWWLPQLGVLCPHSSVTWRVATSRGDVCKHTGTHNGGGAGS